MNIMYNFFQILNPTSWTFKAQLIFTNSCLRNINILNVGQGYKYIFKSLLVNGLTNRLGRIPKIDIHSEDRHHIHIFNCKHKCLWISALVLDSDHSDNEDP